MKKILILTDWYEPGYKAGGPIRSCRNFVEQMHDRFELFLLTANKDLGEDRPYEDIQSDTWINRGAQVKAYYADRGKLTAHKLLGLIHSVEPDYLFINSMYSYQFTILPLLLKARGKYAAGIVLAPRGMLQQGAMKFKTIKKKFFIALMNASGIPSKISFQATDEQEKQDILRYFPKAKSVSVISNFTGGRNGPPKPIEKKPAEIKVVYISRIIPKKNLLFFIKLLAEVHFTFNICLNIHGEMEDKAYWAQCEEVIRGLKKNIGVQYRGPLPHVEVDRVLGEHHLFVLPTEGENFGHAIFEALSCGRPVLISDQTPWRNLQEHKAGWDIPLYAPSLFVNGLSQAIAFDQKTFDEWSGCAADFAAAYSAASNAKEDYLTLFS
jgi:glycosyltransferase involved in cell wall biosynthesis